MKYNPALDGMTKRTFVLAALGLAVLGWMLREYYVLVAALADPLQGDASQYYRYAVNLLERGAFTNAFLSQPAIPDAYRGPGYPTFLAGILWLDRANWPLALAHAQAVLGGLTVAVSIALARQSLARGWALVVGLLVALWPHLIAAANVPMSETLFGLSLVTALWLTSRNALGAGLAYGAAYLVNPVVALLPVGLAALWRTRRMAVVAIACCLVIVAWTGRNAIQHATGGSDRIYANFVQGTDPSYHTAFQYQLRDPAAKAHLHELDVRAQELQANPRAGLADFGHRVAESPLGYAEWYAAKPYLLWDWDVRVGFGDVYIQTVDNSPLERHWLLRGAEAALMAVNPFVFGLAVLGAALGLWRRDALGVVGLAFLYFTALHTVLQAEPRYSIPYRPIEIVLAVAALAWLVRLPFPVRSPQTQPAA